jgi:RNA recognition motif-containing protein
MLQKDPANRVSAFEALEHKWFKMHPEIQTNNDRESNGLASAEKGKEGNNNIYNLNNDVNDYDMFNF